MSQPRQIELTIVNLQVNGAVKAAQTVEKGERKIKKPLPKPKPKAGPGGKGAISQMGSPQMVETEPADRLRPRSAHDFRVRRYHDDCLCLCWSRGRA